VTNTNPLVSYLTNNNQSGVYRILRGDVGDSVSQNYQIEYREGTLTVLKESLLTEGAVSPLAAGLHYTLVVESQGTVRAFGSNTNRVTNLPTILTDGTAEVAGVGSGAAANFGMAWTRDGAGVVWGSLTNTNVSGANALTNVVGMAGGNGFVGYVRGDGTVGVWGTNMPAGGVVPSSLTNSNTAGVVGVAVGDSHLVAVRTNGSVVGWGTTQFGLNNPPALDNAVAVGAGIYHGVAVKGDGAVAVWGNNTFGGLNVPPELTNRLTNTFVRAVAVAAGYQYSLVLRADGTVRGWGSGSPTNLPTNLSSTMGINPIVSLALEQNHVVAMQRDGTVTTWLPTAASVESNSVTLLVPAGLKGRVPMGGADSDRDGWANEAELRVGSDPLSRTSQPVKASFGVNFSYGTNGSTFIQTNTVVEGSDGVVGTLAILDTMGRLEDGNQAKMTVELSQESLKTFEPVSRTNRVLRFKSAPVYDGVTSNNVYKVDVLVKDSESSAALMTTLTVNVGNVAPQITVPVSFSVDENVPIGSGVGTVQASEGSVTWSITSGNELGLFAIDGQSGQIKTAKAIDYEALTNKTVTLVVRVTDAGGLSGSASVPITVRDVYEGMTPELWLSGSGLTTISQELLLKYAIGGASSPTGSSEATVTVLDSNKLLMTAVVRTNDPSLSVIGEVGVDLSNWSSSGVSMVPSVSQVGVPEGYERRIYSVDRANSPSSQFLRVKVTR
jgi:alpha-tubulin suppressor-like RCC1 family protein